MLGIETQRQPGQTNEPKNAQRILNSSAKRLIAAYLQAYPYTYDRTVGFAQRLQHPADDLQPALDDLVEKNVVLKMGHGSSALYALNIHDGWHEALNAYFNQHPRAPRQLDKILSALL
ncbi:MAG TPA: hypothetical protein VHV83_02880 [Armatimonadota bacterium]|nr:hypothetical protein [Armatimonadota bacterium]